MRKIAQTLIFISLSGIFLSGSTLMIEGMEYLTNIILLLSCLGIITIYVLNYRRKTKVPVILTCLFFLFIFFLLISSFINSNEQMLLSSIRYILVFVTLSIIVPNLLKEKTIVISIWAFLLSQFPLLLISFIELNPFTNPTLAYWGVFHNPNSFGIYSATIFIVILAVFNTLIGLKKYFFQLILLVMLVFFFIMVIFSGSRTGLISISIITLINLLLLLKNSFNFKKVSIEKIRSSLLFLFFIFISILIFKQSNYYQIFEQRILEKFIRKINAGDVLDQRGDIIKVTINETSMFGHGPDYFIQTFGTGAHNSFISILGQYGAIATISFIVFCLYSLFKSVKYYLISENEFKILPIITILFFILTSMTEIMLMKSSMLLVFILIGLVNLEKNYFNKIYKLSNL